MEVDGDRIHVTHLNVRPSISLLLVQLILLNILAALIITVGYIMLINSPVEAEIFRSLTGLVILWLVFTFEIFLTIYAALQWINDYYELNTHNIVHRKGLIFRKIEKHPMEKLSFLTVDQGILGKILNYGTITFLDARREKLLDLYSIHDPNKYLEVVESLKPNIDRSEAVLRGSVNEEEDVD